MNRISGFFIGSLLCLSTLSGQQVIVEQDELIPERPATTNKLQKLGEGQWPVPVGELPLVAGAPDATHWVLVFSKWNCEFCHLMHESWNQVLATENAPSVAVVVLPGMRDGQAGSVETMMLLLWRANQESYHMISELLRARVVDPGRPADVEARINSLLGADVWAKAKIEHTPWVQKQLNLSGKIQEEMDRRLGEKGSFPQVLTDKTARLGHIGPRSSYREFLVEQGYASQGWATQANSADPETEADAGRRLMEARLARAPQKLDKTRDLGVTPLPEGKQGREVVFENLVSTDFNGATSNHGSLQVKIVSPPGPLRLHLSWFQGLGPGPWEVVLRLRKVSGGAVEIPVRGIVPP